jgi:tRNA nucleotidyltransferase (CCA-adding enzyme)
MVAAGEVDTLVPERVWKELSRGLMADKPSRLLHVLAQVQALPRLMPGFSLHPHLEANLDRAAQAALPLASRYALLCRETTTREALSQHLRVPRVCSDYARLLPGILQGLEALQAAAYHTAPGTEASQAQLSLNLLERCDALRQPKRFIDLLQAVAVLQPLDIAAWQNKLRVLDAIDAGAIAQQCQGEGAWIKAALSAARLAALQRI